MEKFEVGERVIVLKPPRYVEDEFTVGKEYEIRVVDTFSESLHLTCDRSRHCWWVSMDAVQKVYDLVGWEVI